VVGHCTDRLAPCSRIVLLRPADAGQVAALRRRHPSVPIIGDWDDLLFAEPELMPAVVTGLRSRKAQAARCAAARAALAAVDGAIVSTQALADEVHTYRPGLALTVAPNEPDPAWVAQGRALYRQWCPGDPYLIRWLIGSTAREADLAVVAPALRAVLVRHPTWRLEIVGQVDVQRADLPAGRVCITPAVPYDALAGWYAGAWVVIAPLADGRFNRAKSPIKASEAAAFGTPCIASPLPAFAAEMDGLVLTASTTEEWLAQFEALADDTVRTALAVRLHQWYTARQQAAPGHRAWCGFLGLPTRDGS
jgi:hypothetical protein